MAFPAAALSGTRHLLGGHKVLGRRMETAGDAVALVRQGLPFAALEALSRELDLPREVIAAGLRLPVRTLARRRGARLAHTESERVLRLARAGARAIEVFGSAAIVRRWIQKPSRALGGATPLALLDTDLGAEEVMDELGRIEHGIHA